MTNNSGNNFNESDLNELSQSPNTPKSDFGNFTESILTPCGLDSPIIPFTTSVLTPSSRYSLLLYLDQ